MVPTAEHRLLMGQVEDDIAFYVRHIPMGVIDCLSPGVIWRGDMYDRERLRLGKSHQDYESDVESD